MREKERKGKGRKKKKGKGKKRKEIEEKGGKRRVPHPTTKIKFFLLKIKNK